MGIFDFKIGFMPVSIFDLLDILIVGYLLYQLYRLLRGSIAFNIFLGVVTLIAVWWLVKELEMELLTAILTIFVDTGFIILIIIFQPEVRRFLLYLGNNTFRQRFQFLARLLDKNFEERTDASRQTQAINSAMMRMSRRRTGALIVFSRNISLEGIVSGGVVLDAQISEALLESIFNKESPLHDGAVIIFNHKVYSASVVLPVSENPDLPSSVGLRHRAAVGLSERSNAVAFVVSEETGAISFAYEGKLRRKVKEEDLIKLLEDYYE
jgi:diadenylate cyclase